MYCPVISNVSIIILSCPSTHFYLFIDVAFLLYCTCLFYIEQLCFKQPFPAPDLGLGRLGSCPGPPQKGPPQKHIFFFKYGCIVQCISYGPTCQRLQVSF